MCPGRAGGGEEEKFTAGRPPGRGRGAGPGRAARYPPAVRRHPPRFWSTL